MRNDKELPLIPKQMPRWFWPLVALVCLSFAAFTASVLTTMAVRRNSDPVKQALELARKDARVAALAAPGEQVEPGLLVVGDSKTIEGEEVRRWKFAIKGSKGEGTLLVNAVRPVGGDAWTVDFLQAWLPTQGSDLITLVGDPAHPPLDFATADARRAMPQTLLALAAARKDPRVAALGEPIEAGYWVKGAEPSTLDGAAHCAWSFKLKGTKAQGLLRFVAVRAKDSRDWKLEELAATLPGSVQEIALPLPQEAPKKK